MIEQLIAEATECDFKVALETKKPKSWLKSVSAFSNGIGGTLFFGVSDDREPIGLSDVQKDAEAISRLIKEKRKIYKCLGTVFRILLLFPQKQELYTFLYPLGVTILLLISFV